MCCAWNSIAPDLAPETFNEDRLKGATSFAETHQEIAEKYLELIKHGEKDILGTGYDDGNKAFANGEGVMMINGNWVLNQLTTANPDVNDSLETFSFEYKLALSIHTEVLSSR